MSQSHRSNGRATDEAFQEQCFLWERRASVTFYIQRKLFKTQRGRKKKTEKHKSSSLQ